MKGYKRIRDLREDNDLTQKEVADKLYLQREVYRRYEAGEREIPFNIAIMIAEIYGVSLDYIAGRTNNKYNNESITIHQEKNENATVNINTK